MKAFKKIWFCMLLCVLVCSLMTFTACSNDDDDTTTSSSEDTVKSLEDKINSGEVSDLKNETVTEDITIKKALTLKNADFNGKTITVASYGVTLDNIKNANIKIDIANGKSRSREAIVPQEDHTSGNPVAIKDCVINNLEVKTIEAHIILESTSDDATKVSAVTISAQKVTIEEKKNDAGAAATTNKVSITSMTITKDAESATIGKVTIETLVVSAEKAVLGEVTVSKTLTLDTSEITLGKASVAELSITKEIKDASDVVKITVTDKDAEIKKVTTNDSQASDNTPVINVVAGGELAQDENVDDSAIKGIIKDENVQDKIQVIEITKIEITGNATNTIYGAGDLAGAKNEFDYTGLNALITYSDETTKTIDLDKTNSEVANFNGDVLTDSGTATVTYKGKKVQNGTYATKSVTYKVLSCIPYKTCDDGTIILTFIPVFYDLENTQIEALYDGSENDFFKSDRNDDKYVKDVVCDASKINAVYLASQVSDWGTEKTKNYALTKNNDGTYSITLSAKDVTRWSRGWYSYKFIVKYTIENKTYFQWIGHNLLKTQYQEKVSGSYAQLDEGSDKGFIEKEIYEAYASGQLNMNTSAEHTEFVPYKVSGSTYTFTFNSNHYVLENNALYDNSDNDFASNPAQNKYNSVPNVDVSTIVKVHFVCDKNHWNAGVTDDNYLFTKAADGTWSIAFDKSVLDTWNDEHYQFIIEYKIDNKQYFEWLEWKTMTEDAKDGVSNLYANKNGTNFIVKEVQDDIDSIQGVDENSTQNTAYVPYKIDGSGNYTFTFNPNDYILSNVKLEDSQGVVYTGSTVIDKTKITGVSLLYQDAYSYWTHGCNNGDMQKNDTTGVWTLAVSSSLMNKEWKGIAYKFAFQATFNVDSEDYYGYLDYGCMTRAARKNVPNIYKGDNMFSINELRESAINTLAQLEATKNNTENTQYVPYKIDENGDYEFTFNPDNYTCIPSGVTITGVSLGGLFDESNNDTNHTIAMTKNGNVYTVKQTQAELNSAKNYYYYFLAYYTFDSDTSDNPPLYWYNCTWSALTNDAKIGVSNVYAFRDYSEEHPGNKFIVKEIKK